MWNVQVGVCVEGSWLASIALAFMFTFYARGGVKDDAGSLAQVQWRRFLRAHACGVSWICADAVRL